MNLSLYRLSGRFKGLLFILALVIIIVLLVYTQHIVNQLREDAREILLFYAQLIARAASEESEMDLNFVFDQIIQRTNFPIVQTGPDGTPTAWKGIDIDPNDRSPETIERVRKIVDAMAREIEPIPVMFRNEPISYLYYGDSKLIKQLQLLPYIEIGVVTLFILVGFLGFRSIQRSEQQFIWVGMAKETAHQLGTPISSLLGWLELIRSKQSTEDLQRILDEMTRDVERLNKITQRFSQIGSQAELKPTDVRAVLSEVVRYFQRRLPQTGKQVRIVEEYQPVPEVPLNKELFEWVVENLIKNSLDAIDTKEGQIRIQVGNLVNRHHRVYIDVSDTGRGIDAGHRRNIFKPGFSTKKRGWGLGLSLARRIIHEYHGGKLLLKETRPGGGTTMRIVL